MALRGLFISGTDTGVGKTMVAAAIARQWRREGRLFHVCKPVATGAVLQHGRLVSDDTRALAEAAGDGDWQAITPHVLEAAAAPPVAARVAGALLDLPMLAGAVHRRAIPGGAVLVEGVGGLLCPLTEASTVADLIGDLDLPLLVVARRALGTLNHTLLTLEAARRRRLRVAGLILNATTPVHGIAEETSVEELRRRIDVPLLAVVPHQGARHDAEMREISSVNWWSLLA
jgi:dethiobiotin synthetase